MERKIPQNKTDADIMKHQDITVQHNKYVYHLHLHELLMPLLQATVSQYSSLIAIIFWETIEHSQYVAYRTGMKFQTTYSHKRIHYRITFAACSSCKFSCLPGKPYFYQPFSCNNLLLEILTRLAVGA